MMPKRWLLLMSRWAKRPPSTQRVILVFSIIAICLALYGLERAGALPDWMLMDPAKHRGLRAN